ncbi:ankyrin repeat-containing protein [Paramecium bursaria Chlorella virus KS1B]|nr:ankyrin repeat-containing protein [Paramecium bursaria Chlorella virus KS1B]
MEITKTIKDNDIVKFKELLRDFRPLPYEGFNIAHEAVSRSRKEMLELILEKFPDMVRGVDFPYGLTPIMYTIMGCDMDMLNVFDSYPEAYTITNFDEDLPLHFAIKTKDFDIIKFVYSRNESAIKYQNSKGHHPLHIAACYGCEVDIIKFLYDRYPEQNNVSDINGNYPLHLCGKFLMDERYKTSCYTEGSIDFLAKINPDILKTPNDSGDTPIHLFATLYTTPFPDSVLVEDIRKVVNMSPETLLTKNNLGFLPVHIASMFMDYQLVDMFVEMYPETMYTRTNKGKTVLDYLECAKFKNKCQFISKVLSICDHPREEFWNFIPMKLPGIEKYLHMIYMKNKHNFHRILRHVTKKVREDLIQKYKILHVCCTRKGIYLEREIINNIVLKTF